MAAPMVDRLALAAPGVVCGWGGWVVVLRIIYL